MAMTDKPPPAASAPAETPQPTGAAGWLNVVRSRLRLPSGPSLRDSIEETLKTAEDGKGLSAEEREMMLRIMRFGALRVDDLMVPRAEIIAIDENETVGELLRTFDSAGVSRIPVFRETLDDPRGMIHIKDLVRWMMGDSQGRPISEGRAAPQPRSTTGVDHTPLPTELPNLGRADLARPITALKIRRQVLYVPPSMPAMGLLLRMQTQHVHMALIVDEYGGTDGLLTIEDLVEQIVGEIEDEHDREEAANIVEDPKLGILAAARTPVAEVEAMLGVKLLTVEMAEEIDTLGGLIVAIAGRVPSRSELVRHASGVEFEIIDADPRRVKKVKIHRTRAAGRAGAPAGGPVPAKS